MLWWTKRGVVVVGDREVRENTGSTYTHTHTHTHAYGRAWSQGLPTFRELCLGEKEVEKGGWGSQSSAALTGRVQSVKIPKTREYLKGFPQKCEYAVIMQSLSLSLHHLCFCVRVTLSFVFFLYIQSTARRGERTRVEKGEKRYDCERTGKAKWTLSCPLGCEKQWPFSAGHQS